MSRWCAPLLVVLSLAYASSARADEDQRYMTWLGFFAHGPIAGDLWLWADLQPRFYDVAEPQALLVRPGLSWRALPELYLTLGYAWTPSWTRTPEPREWGDLEFVDEHRIWQQILYAPTDGASGVAGQLRARVEERLRPQGELDVGVRLRILARLSAPISRARDFIVVVWDEAFVALNDAASWQRGGFDQNRFFFGIGWQAIASVLRFELGYLNQWLVREPRDVVNHAAAFFAFVGWR